MILVNQNNFLTYNKKHYKCSLGINGLSKSKIEGDKSTPVGTFSLGNLFVRTDRIKNLKTNFNYISIDETMAWSDDSNSKDYNKLIKVTNSHKEIMYRNDNIYDLILVVNYNIYPIIPNKGSAIFLHISRDNNSPTQGCVALNLDDFREILITLKPSDKIKIYK
ncbi:L,D-transpeptidase family protein [Alphaproteobacteria bacterium]|nr:L,D-transpeptidase family protein [Alphaproteobacteria bacterium]